MHMYNAKLAKRAKFIYLFIVVLGALLAGAVFSLANIVKLDAQRYMEVDLTVVVNVQHVGKLLNEQERILYEYYATTEPHLYINEYLKSFTLLSSRLYELIELGADTKSIDRIQQLLVSSQSMARQLHFNLALESTDWDLARDQLEHISADRRAILPVLDEIESRVTESVNNDYNAVIQMLNATVGVVAVFAMVVALVCLYLGRYTARYIQLSAENDMLALFPKRNPNPVIRINSNKGVMYANPAAEPILPFWEQQQTADGNTIQQLLDDSLHTAKTATDSCNQKVIEIDERFYNFQTHWLADYESFDIHVRDITQRYTAEQALEFQAYHHAATGIRNRLFFEKSCDAYIVTKTSFSAVMIDVADFKFLTENYGLADALSCVYSFAARLKASVGGLAKAQAQDYYVDLYHVADACFMLLFKSKRPSSTLPCFLTGIYESLGDCIETPLGEMRFNVNFGVAEYPANSPDYASLLLHTNIAVEKAMVMKQAIHYFNNDDGKAHQRRLHITTRLESAIHANRLVLYYQPKLRLNDTSVTSCECLLRWFDEGHFISPAEFVPIAEKSGLILPLGEWVLDNAFRQVKAWTQEGKQIQVAINISARQFLQPNFVASIARRISFYDIPAELIELELTETSMMDNRELAIQTLTELTNLGISLSIDDFGTGYSSLAYLSEFSVDKVKIDRSFVSKMVESPKEQAIVLTICQLARNLGLEVIAEGVETQQQQALLQRLGCDYIQGYLFAKPGPVDAIDYLFSQERRLARAVS